MTDKATQAAEALIEARAGNQPLTAFPAGTAPSSVEEAFAIQDAILTLTGDHIGAWKVGPASDVFPPTCAAIAATRVLHSPARLSRSLRLKAVECEVAFRLGRDMPPRDGPYTANDARAAVTNAMVAIEAVETRYDGWPVKDPLWALADSQSNEALIISKEIPLSDVASLDDLIAELHLGTIKKPADKGFPGGDPFGLIAWLAGHLATRAPVLANRGLKEGDIITTGSWNGVDFAQDGMTVKAVYLGLGSAELGYN